MRDATSTGPSDSVSAGDCGVPLDLLRGLLQKQLELVHQGSLGAAAALFEQTDPCVRRIVESRMSRQLVGDPQWQSVEQLYRELSLALTAQRAEVSAALDIVRQSRKVLSAYGTPLSSP